MSAPAIRPEQIRAIHAIKTRARLDEASYRAMLQPFGVPSSKYLSAEDANRLLSRMRDIPGADRPAGPARRDALAGPYAGKLQALWIAAWNLGLVQDKRDAALHRFVERQSGIPHTRFLREAGDAAAAIEGLKAWIARGAGIDWPERSGDRTADRLALKRAVIVAQWRRLVALGAVRALGMDAQDSLVRYVATVTRGLPRGLGSLDCPSLTAEELDTAASALGRKLRAALDAGGSGR